MWIDIMIKRQMTGTWNAVDRDVKTPGRRLVSGRLIDSDPLRPLHLENLVREDLLDEDSSSRIGDC
jgi:hypothetical protein